MCVTADGYQHCESIKFSVETQNVSFCLFFTDLGAQRCVDQYSKVEASVTENLLDTGGCGQTSKSSSECIL